MNDYGFKFSIGDTLRPVAAAVPLKIGTGRRLLGGEDVRLFVVGRKLEECPGGVQRHYVCRYHTSTGHFGTTFTEFNEIELVASQPFSADAETPESAT